jgi:hypothetical protein
VPIVFKSGSPNVQETSGPVQAFNGIVLYLPLSLRIGFLLFFSSHARRRFYSYEQALKVGIISGGKKNVAVKQSIGD